MRKYIYGRISVGEKEPKRKRIDKIPVGYLEIQSEYQAIKFLPFIVVVCKSLLTNFCPHLHHAVIKC